MTFSRPTSISHADNYDASLLAITRTDPNGLLPRLIIQALADGSFCVKYRYRSDFKEMFARILGKRSYMNISSCTLLIDTFQRLVIGTSFPKETGHTFRLGPISSRLVYATSFSPLQNASQNIPAHTAFHSSVASIPIALSVASTTLRRMSCSVHSTH